MEVSAVAKITAKTNAVREMERLKVPLKLVEYQVDENDLGAAHVAEETGFPLECIFKTLVLRCDGRAKDLIVASIPGALELDLKRLAALAGKNRVEMVHQRELFELTGYIRGGCSPVGMKRRFPFFLHVTALSCKNIAVSAGRRGLQMVLSPTDLLKATGGIVGDFARDPVPDEEKTW